MSRYLQRLVRRANGARDALKPRTPALFESLPSTLPSAPEEAASPTPDRSMPPERSAIAPTHAPPSPDAMSARAPRLTAPSTRLPDGLATRPIETPTVQLPESTTATAPPALASRSDSAPGDSEIVPMRDDQNARHWPTAPAAVSATEHAVQAPTTAVDDRTARAEDTARPHLSRARKTVSAAVSAAVSIAPPPVDSRPAKNIAQTQPDAPAHMSRGVQENVVHVTIERFEVRATDAPAPKRKARTRPKRDDSLADYARRRQERKR